MAFPPGAHVPHELPALCIGGLTPQAADMRSHRVQWCLPIDALGDRIAAMPTQFADQLSRRTNAVILGQKIDPGRWLSPHMGQQAVPGKHLDRPAMPRLFQRHHGIDHGQARADDQDRRIRIELSHGHHIPRIERRRIQAAGFGLRRARSREHSGGQHRESALQALAIAQGQPHRIRIGLQIHHLGPHMFHR